MTVTAKNRTCKVCGEYQDISNFQPQGLQCRTCRSEKQRAYWASLPEDVKVQRRKNGEYQRRYRELNKEKVQEDSRKRHLKRKFNLTVEEYDTMLEAQDGNCAICRKECETGYALAVDHNHANGRVRALLCKNCNTAIGLFKENTAVLQAAIDYLNFHAIVQPEMEIA